MKLAGNMLLMDMSPNRQTTLPKLGRYLTSTFVLVAIIYSISTWADSTPKMAEEKTFDVKSDVTFSNYKSLIDGLARRRGTHWAINNFCVVGLLNDDQTKSVWILWSQGRKIYLWEGQDEVLEKTRGTIDLGKDVVNTENDLHGSTYLVTKVWVDDLTETCNRIGEKIRIPTVKKASPKKSHKKEIE
jgi:hypothetical protein